MRHDAVVGIVSGFDRSVSCAPYNKVYNKISYRFECVGEFVYSNFPNGAENPLAFK